MRVKEASLGWRKQLLSGAVSLLQKQLPHVASKRLAPTQCQALEAKAEEVSPPPRITFRGRGGGGVCQGFLSALWAAQAVFLANPSGGPRCSEVPSPSPRK